MIKPQTQLTDAIEIESERVSSIHGSTANTTQPSVVSSSPDGRFSRFAEGFRALRVRNDRLYWFGQMVSLIGTTSNTFNVSVALTLCSALCVAGVGLSVWYQHGVRGRPLESSPAL